jgi:hypothetical protein
MTGLLWSWKARIGNSLKGKSTDGLGFLRLLAQENRQAGRQTRLRRRRSVEYVACVIMPWRLRGSAELAKRIVCDDPFLRILARNRGDRALYLAL